MYLIIIFEDIGMMTGIHIYFGLSLEVTAEHLVNIYYATSIL